MAKAKSKKARVVSGKDISRLVASLSVESTDDEEEEDRIEVLVDKVQAVENALSVIPQQENFETLEAYIANREERLEIARRNLKAHFVGLDVIIDKIIEDIRVWFIMPGLISRPVIICLWGMTGVGKTDLVRRLVKELGVAEKYLEAQMSSDGAITPTWSRYSNSSGLKGMLESSSIEPGEPGILLIDEIQKFRSINERAEENPSKSKFEDIWTLLSDGRFENVVSKEELYGTIFGYEYLSGWASEKDEKKCFNKKYGKQIGLRRARKLKRFFRLKESVEEIMKYSEDHVLELASEKIEKQEVFSSLDYSKLLIFVSGNLDEAYKMTKRNISDVDTDADILHEFSKKIDYLTIKACLTNRFRPEQIARFGSNFIIYPCLSSENFIELIQSRFNQISNDVREKFGMHLEFDSSVLEFVYRNGVIPVQGVRPTLSTINQYIENNIPTALMKALQNGEHHIAVSYTGNTLQFRIGSDVFEKELIGVIDKTKKKISKDTLASVAVHEAGHAILYAYEHGVVPTQVVANSSSMFSDFGGFNGLHDASFSKDMLISRIRTLMAGRAAEEVVFGEKLVSTGSLSDFMRSSRMAADYIRRYGFGGLMAYHVAPEAENPHHKEFTGDISSFESKIPRIVNECFENARKVLQDRRTLLLRVSDVLVREKTISQEHLAELLNEYGISVEIVSNKHLVIESYSDILDKALSEI